MCSGVTSIALKGDGLGCTLTLWWGDIQPAEGPVTGVLVVLFSVVLVGHVAVPRPGGATQGYNSNCADFKPYFLSWKFSKLSGTLNAILFCLS